MVLHPIKNVPSEFEHVEKGEALYGELTDLITVSITLLSSETVHCGFSYVIN